MSQKKVSFFIFMAIAMAASVATSLWDSESVKAQTRSGCVAAISGYCASHTGSSWGSCMTSLVGTWTAGGTADGDSCPIIN
jgi:hypothetical protein